MSSESNPTVTDLRPAESPAVEIVVPVYNEAATLAANVATLRDFLAANLPQPWRIVIADNASTDATLAIAHELAAGDARIRAFHLDRKGRGRALKAAWLTSEAAVVAYMDVDLSTNLAALPPLLAPLLAGEADVAIGSRLTRGAIVTRQWKREALSRGYNLLIRLLFRPGFADAQCGFKAMTRAAAQALLPAVENDAWFFDTELLLLAAARGCRIREVPVEWVEDLDSRVDIPKTIAEDLRGLWRMRCRREARPAPAAGSPRLAARRDAGRSVLP
jgi:glycosyltransferase involved in cell wall biosynthesis